MSTFEKIISPVRFVFKYHKKTILLIFVSALVFAVVLFPYDDLSDLITEMIAKNSQNQVFVQFDKMGVGFLPPSIRMENVEVDAQVLPTTLKAGALRLAPSIAGFLAFSPGFTAAVDDVMKGDASLTYRAGKKVNDSVQLQKVNLDLNKIDLKQLAQFMSLPFDIEGVVNATLSTQIDPNFIEQPDGELELKIDKFNFPSATIPTMMGPTTLPTVKLSRIAIKGQVRGAELFIEESTIGGPGEALNGKIKGRFGMRLIRQGQSVVPMWTNYEIKIDLILDKSAEKDFGLFLSFFDKYKTLTGTGSRYAMKLSAPNFQSPPTPAPLGTF